MRWGSRTFRRERKGVLAKIAPGDEPVEETADLPEVAVAGLRRETGEPAQVGVEMSRLDARHVLREALLAGDAQEA
jgi:hypothetical protein